MKDQRSDDAVQPIRAFLRGLGALEALNRHDGMTVSAIAQEVGLPRTTVYRILVTLCAGGYAVRDPHDDLYRTTSRVGRLAGGFSDEPWITTIAEPAARQLCAALRWPVMMSMVRGGAVHLRLVTDDMSPYVLERHAPGGELNLATTPSGAMRLAAANDAEREVLLQLARADGASDEDCAQASAVARDAASQGYALDLRVVNGEAGLAAPIYDAEGDLRAILAMRFIRSALSPEKAAEMLAPRLVECAAAIGERVPLAEKIAPAPAPDAANDADPALQRALQRASSAPLAR